ncbi:MAG TPA: sugar ABC transporter permease [Anaerolineae bacterium]|nr:sugar ABC transporter permease [Anaerolineae bacterium]HMR66417.1 sugar ABC transporter permease [Anaerolineae bacterium]
MTVDQPLPARPSLGQRLKQALTARKAGERKQHNWAGYLFISPWLIGFFTFVLLPIVASFVLAFTRYDILSPPEWVGLQNFERMFTADTRYWRSVRATFYYVFTAVPLRLVFALAVAMLLNTARRGVGVYRAVYYAPSIVGGSVAVAVMWREIFGNEGVVNFLLYLIGIPPVSWLGNPNTAIWTLITLAAWQFGSPMLIFLAGLKQIPGELYEAAAIDGAAAWSKFRNVTLPLLTPIIFFNLVMQIINGFMVFTQAFIISGGTGRPLDTTLFYSLYLYIRAFTTFEMGYSSAMAWVLLLIIALFTGIIFKSSSSWVFYSGES